MAKVLIVEDDNLLSQAYKVVLKKKGHKVDIAENGAEALSKVDDSTPDLILLDLLMPKMNGLEFMRKYKPLNHPEVRIVVFSNLDMDKEIEEAQKLGADRYILKAGAAPSHLAKIVDSVLAKKNRSLAALHAS